MKRAWILLVLAAAAGLLWWLASGLGGEQAPGSGGVVQRPAAQPPAQAEGLGAQAPPEQAAPPPDSQPTVAVDAQPAASRPPHYAGIVVRKVDGTLLAGAVVAALGADGALITRVTSPDGRFDFGPEVTSQAPASLEFTWRDRVSESRGDGSPREVTARLDPTRLQTPPDQIRVELDTGWIARGKVIDVDKVAITAAKVSLGEVEVARSRVDGTFVVRDLDPNAGSIRFLVEGNGWFPNTADVPAPPQGQSATSFEVVLAQYEPPDYQTPPDTRGTRNPPR